MSKLGRLSGALKPLGPRIPYLERKPDAERDASAQWRGWYKTARWQRLRWSVISAALFACARCGRVEVDTSKLVADHITPHRGDPALFWDAGNLQCLCKRCHDADKQREEAADRRRQPWGGG